jgi:inosose dehydratase
VDGEVSAPIRICTAPGTWGIEPVGNPAQAPFALVLDEVAAAGFDGIELGPLGYLPDEPERLVAQLSSRGLELSAGFLMEPFHDPGQTLRILRTAERTCELLAGAGAGILVLIGSLAPERSDVAGRPAGSRMLEGRERTCFMEMLSSVLDVAGHYGVVAAFHPHAGTYVEYEREIDQLLEEANGRLGLCVDTGHCLYAGIDPVRLLERYAERVRHVHLKDVRCATLRRVLEQELSFEEAVSAGVFCALGDGDAELEPFLDRLHSIGYDGWATYEQDRLAEGFIEARADAERSLAHLRALGVHTRLRSG